MIRAALVCAIVLAALAPGSLRAQEIDPSLFSGMSWRLIGPFRAGRALTATGVPGRPEVFYFGAVGGGVWKTVDGGRTWNPIFDSEPIASIGAIAVAPSNPAVIYVGSGEADMRDDISYGNGMYKSTDAGKTWTRIGLEDSRQIGQIVVDPQNPDRLFVAALGHAYGSNAERGVFRSTDGGATWQKVLFKDENTGAIDLALDPRDVRTVYAVLWNTRRPPWEVYPPSYGGGGLYKSTDGGDTWHQLTEGLPTEGLGRMGISISRSQPDRVYLLVDAKDGGVYRSDDAGAHFQLTDNERRIWGRGWYFGGITADPKNPDVVYVCNTSTYRSTDGGKSFDAIKGAPGGDDYHSLSIAPDDPDRMILSSDQGVVISVDGAKTWTSWYNQPTAQFYHVITDSHFPYWVCGPQQDSGALCTESRSHSRGISTRDWRPVGVGGESQYIAPDPLNPDIYYGGSFGAAVGKFNLATDETQDVAPSLTHPGDYRHTWTLPTVISPRDPREIYTSAQILFRSKDAGNTWQVLSPDLTREDPGAPPNLDAITAADVPAGEGNRRGVIYTIAPSPLVAGEIWIGTDDGLIQVTHDDGKTWHNVTPPELTAWSKISILEASRHDPNGAYAAVDRHRLEDQKPHFYRTRDGGKTWQEISKGIPEGSYAQAIREDPVQKGLLFAGTETGVFVSFNDGDEWQPLQLNLPNCSVRDLVIKDDDLVIGTHGRSFWILDDITPLRQARAAAGSAAYLFKPPVAYRVRPEGFEGTPLPLDEAQGTNPPDGAFIDYYLQSAPNGPVTLEVLDSAGKLVRSYSSDDRQPRADPRRLDIPAVWVHPPLALSAAPGMHRFVWDVTYANSASGGQGQSRFRGGVNPWAPPGEYQVKLTVDGKSYVQPLTLKMDPRVKTSQADLMKQFELVRQIGAEQAEVSTALRAATHLHDQLQSLTSKASGTSVAAQISELDRKTVALAGPAPTPGSPGEGEPPAIDVTTFRSLNTLLGQVARAVESADVAPSTDAVTAFTHEKQGAEKALARWTEIKTQDVPKLNTALKQAGLPTVTLEERGARRDAEAPSSTDNGNDDDDFK